MKNIVCTLFLASIILTSALADDYNYNSPYGGKKIGKIDGDGFIYDSPYGGNKVGRIEDNGKLYNQPYGGKAVGRYEDGKVYDDPYGGKAVGSTDRKEGAGSFLLKGKNAESQEK